jgi:hypothetical protein
MACSMQNSCYSGIDKIKNYPWLSATYLYHISIRGYKYSITIFTTTGHDHLTLAGLLENTVRRGLLLQVRDL